jgi:hypothetical protein
MADLFQILSLDLPCECLGCSIDPFPNSGSSHSYVEYKVFFRGNPPARKTLVLMTLCDRHSAGKYSM